MTNPFVGEIHDQDMFFSPSGLYFSDADWQANLENWIGLCNQLQHLTAKGKSDYTQDS